MMHDPIEAIRDAADGLSPDAAARERVLDAIRRPSPAAMPLIRRRRRAPRIAFGAALAGAAAIAAGVALWPGGGSTNGGTSRVVPTAAAAALQRAADAAGQEDWKPLAQGDFQHVYSTSFTPSMAEFQHDPQFERFGGGPPFGTQSRETWIDRSGRGQSLLVYGSANPARVPVLRRDPRTGKVMTVGGSSLPQVSDPPPSVRASLLAASSINLMAWPTSGPSRQVGWSRSRAGYLRTFDFVMNERTMGARQDAEVVTRQNWGASVQEIEALPAGGPDLDPAIVRLLDNVSRPTAARGAPGPITTGAFGVTVASMQREQRIYAAIHLLGSAPLSPNARRALFEWLSRRPGVTLDGAALDAAGRHGTAVRFASLYDRQVPRRRVTSSQLVDEARAAGSHLIGPVEDGDFVVPAHREFRRWVLVAIIDPAHGELMQSTVRAYQTSVGAQLPEIVRQGSGRITIRVQHGVIAGASNQVDGSLYQLRERTRSVVPASLVCSSHPEVCQLPRIGPLDTPPT